MAVGTYKIFFTYYSKNKSNRSGAYTPDLRERKEGEMASVGRTNRLSLGKAMGWVFRRTNGR